MAELTMADCELSLEEIQNMKVTDLKKKLKAFGLPITGNKNELVERLQEACLSNKEGDSFDNSQLSYDESQVNELESAEGNGVLEESALLDQDQFSSYINIKSSLEEDPKVLHSVENNSSSKTVIMPPKKRTFTKISVEAVEKKILLNRTNATDIDFDIEEKTTESKPETVSIDIKEEESSSDEKIKLSLKTMSAAERLAMRAKRFNVNESGVKTTASLKSTNSANRNSKQSILSSATAPDLDKLKKRAERFGQCVSTVMKQIEQKERLLKRKSKFSGVSSATLAGSVTLAGSSVTGVDEQAKKKQRAERFGIS